MRRDAAINRERLVRAAEEVFAERGPTATLEDVAKAAEVGPATLYRRFANKDALVQEVLTGFFQRLIDVAEAAVREPPDVGLEVFLRTVGVELAEKGGLSAPGWGETRARAACRAPARTLDPATEARPTGGVGRQGRDAR